MWIFGAAANTLSVGALVLLLIGLVPGYLAYRVSTKDAAAKKAVGEGANAVQGFDYLTQRLAEDNKDLRLRNLELEKENDRLRRDLKR